MYYMYFNVISIDELRTPSISDKRTRVLSTRKQTINIT